MKKIKIFLLALLPGIAFIAFQSVVVLSLDTVCWILAGVLAKAGLAPSVFLGFVQREGTYLVGIIGNGFFLIFGFLWLRRLNFSDTDRKMEKSLSLKTLGFLMTAGVAIQLVTDVMLIFLQLVSPEIMESYGKVMESLGMMSPTVCSVLYTVVFAPVAEELAFRGLTMRILKHAFPFWGANVIQALLFALLHGNLVQGVYAFLAGLFFGWLLRAYGTLKASILCHLAVNLSGTVLGFFYPDFVVLLPGAAVFTFAAFILGKKNR